MTTEIATTKTQPALDALRTIKERMYRLHQTYHDIVEGLTAKTVAATEKEAQRISDMSPSELRALLDTLCVEGAPAIPFCADYGWTAKPDCHLLGNIRSRDRHVDIHCLNPPPFYGTIWITMRREDGRPFTIGVRAEMHAGVAEESHGDFFEVPVLKLSTSEQGSIFFRPMKKHVPPGPHYTCQVRTLSGSLGARKSEDRCLSSDYLYNIDMSPRSEPKSTIAAKEVKRLQSELAALQARTATIETTLKALPAPLEIK